MNGNHGWGDGGPAGRGADGGPAVSDAELVRYLDGELSAAARADLEARIARAPAAAARLETLQRRSAGLSALLAAVDPTDAEVRGSAERIRADLGRAPAAAAPAARAYARAGGPRAGLGPARLRALHAWRRAPALLRAAAVLLLVAGSAFAVPPSRAWIVQQARAVGAALGLRGAPWSAVPAVDRAAPRGAAVSYVFPVDVDTFTVVAPRDAGTLVVRTGNGPLGRLDPSAGGAEILTAPPRSVQILAGPDTSALYRLTLPARVRALRVRTDDGPGVVHAVPAAGAELRIRLTTR